LSVDALSPNLTGIGRYTLELARHFAVDPTIESIRFFRGSTWVSNPENLVSGVAQKRSRHYLPRWLRKKRLSLEMRDRLFHGPNYFLPPFVESGIITVHDLSVFHFPETHPAERLRHFEQEFASSIDRAVHFITDSQTVRRELIRHVGMPPEHVTAIPLGVSPAFTPHEGQDIQQVLGRHDLRRGCYTLCVSTIEPRKKIAELLKAWRCVPRSITERTPLVIVGGGGWLSDEIKEAMAKGVSDGWVKYLGYVPEADLPSLYAGAALFVYPSSYEGFGLPPIEAMASGVPTIVSNRSCLPEVTQGAAMVIDPDDIEAFATALELGLTDQPWRVQAVSAGMRVASGYSWERCATQTRELYQQVITGQKSAGMAKEI
jgi:alpha-1,3-rhamnosyl/mannosyltransferase